MSRMSDIHMAIQNMKDVLEFRKLMESMGIELGSEMYRNCYKVFQHFYKGE